MAGGRACQYLCVQHGCKQFFIIEAARCARDGNKPPYELKLAWHAREYRALPYAGGLLQQPAGLLARMTACNNVYNAFKQIQSANLVALMNSQPQIIGIVRAVERMEESYVR